MELNLNNYPDFVRNADILWMKGADSVPQYMRNSGIVKEIPIPYNTGNTREFSELEIEEYASRKGESEQARRAKVQQGYTKIGRLYRVAKDIGISFEDRTQGKYPEIERRLTNLGRLAINRLDLDLAHRLTFGTATSYVDMDGETVDISVGDTLALFSTAHTLRGSSTTFRNRLAGNPAFSQGALEAMITMAQSNSYNQFGQKMASFTHDVIWTTENQTVINTVNTLLRSTAAVNGQNSGVINVYQNAFRHVAFPRVATTNVGAPDTTKAGYWGVASSENSTFYLGMHEEPHMKVLPTSAATNGSLSAANAEEFSTDDWNFGTRAGWMIVIVSATWIKFSSGDGTP